MSYMPIRPLGKRKYGEKLRTFTIVIARNRKMEVSVCSQVLNGVVGVHVTGEHAPLLVYGMLTSRSGSQPGGPDLETAAKSSPRPVLLLCRDAALQLLLTARCRSQEPTEPEKQ